MNTIEYSKIIMPQLLVTEVLGQFRNLVGRGDEGDGGREVGVLVSQEGLDLAGHVSRVVGAEL